MPSPRRGAGVTPMSLVAGALVLWLGHRLLRWLERRGFVYYVGLDRER